MKTKEELFIDLKSQLTLLELAVIGLEEFNKSPYRDSLEFGIKNIKDIIKEIEKIDKKKVIFSFIFFINKINR